MYWPEGVEPMQASENLGLPNPLNKEGVSGCSCGSVCSCLLALGSLAFIHIAHDHKDPTHSGLMAYNQKATG